jgi:hypothetical protein
MSPLLFVAVGFLAGIFVAHFRPRAAPPSPTRMVVFYNEAAVEGANIPADIYAVPVDPRVGFSVMDEIDMREY